MKRVAAAAVLMVLALAAAVSWADRAWQTKPYAGTKVRVINAGNVQRWDTLLATPSGSRCVVTNFTAYVHDSGSAAGFHVVFSSKNSATTYLALHDTLLTGQMKAIVYQGPFVFPKDSTIKVSYYMTAGVVDSLYALPTYMIEHAP